MNRKTIISGIAAASLLVIAATSGSALAHGHGGRDGNLGLLARAAGINKSQIHSAFHNDAALKTDFANFKASREAMTTCLVSGASCTTQISAYTSAQQALTQEKMTVWQKLFQSAPNAKNAAAVLGQLNQLKAQKHQLMQSVFNKSGSSGDSGESAQQ
jgi:hypothetical protein